MMAKIIPQTWRNFALLGLALLSWASLALAQKAKPVQAKADLTGELQQILNAEVADNPSLPGEMWHIQAPKQGLNASLAAGLFDRETKRPLESHHVFRVASVTKTFTAAAVLRLAEDGKVKLDDSINLYLPEEYNTLITT